MGNSKNMFRGLLFDARSDVKICSARCKLMLRDV